MRRRAPAGVGMQSKQARGRGGSGEEKRCGGMKVFPLSVCVKAASDMVFVKLFLAFFRNRPRVCKGAGRDERN